MRLTFFLVLCFAFTFGYAQNEIIESQLLNKPFEQVTDSLILAIKNSGDRNTQIEASIWLARIYSIYGIDDKADSLFKSNRRLIINEIGSESDLLALNNIQHSQVYQIHENWVEVKKLVDESIQIKEVNKVDSIEFIDDYNQLVWYYQAIRYFDSANYYADKAIKLSKDLKGNERHYKLAKSYNNKGYTLNYEHSCEVMDWMNLALSEFALQASPHKLTLARIYHNIGNYYNDQFHYKCLQLQSISPILRNYDRSLKIYQTYNNPSRIGLNYYVRSVAHHRRGEIDQSITLLAKSIEQYNSAELINQTMLGIATTRFAQMIAKNIENSDSLKWSYNLSKKLISEFIDRKKGHMSFKEDLFHSSYLLNHGGNFVSHGLRLFESTRDSTYLYEVLNIRNNIKYSSLTATDSKPTLNDNTVIIDYYLAHPNSVAIVDEFNKTTFVILQSNGEINSLIKKYKSLESTKFPVHHNRILYDLYASLIEPVEKSIDLEGKRLLIVPDIALEELDFGSLNTDTIESQDYRDLPYLVYRYDISYLLSNSLINSTEKTIAVSNSIFVSDTTDHTLVFSHNLTEELSALYKKDYSNNDNRVVHLAGHAMPNYNYHELSKLHALDMLDVEGLEENFNNVQMMVIQGCRGADGQVVYSEGKYSFNRMFRSLGVKSVISTRWDIDDKYSSMLLKYFYEELETNNPKSKALANAQKTFITNARSSNEAHPSNWAGMVIYGDDSPIEIAKNKMYNQVEWYAIFITLPLFLFVGKRMLNRHMGEKDQKQSV